MAAKGVPSDEFLMGLHQSLGEVMQHPEFGADFARITRALREQRFPRGQTKLTEVVVDGRLKFRIDVGDRLGADVYFGNYRELMDIEALCRTLVTGDVVIDVGANFGFVSIMAADRLGGKGRVVSFEPDPQARALLTENIKLNRFGRRITVVPKCVGNEDGMTRFHCMTESAFSGMADTGRAKTREVVMVPVQKLDSAARDLKVRRIDVLKIDVEGFEFAVLEGAAVILAKSPDPLVMFEISPKNLDEKRLDRLRRILGGMTNDGWEIWSYAIERSELVRLVSFDDLAEASVGNAFMARAGSARLGRLREAYEGIVTTRLLPLALRKWIGTPEAPEGEGGSPHSLQRLLWNSFVNELTARLQQNSALAKTEVQRLLAQAESSAAALQHERDQRNQAQQRIEKITVDAARGQSQAEQLQQSVKLMGAERDQAKAAVEAERQRNASLAHDLKELNVIINQRDAARMQAEEKLAGAVARAREAEAGLAEQRQALEAERQRAQALEKRLAELAQVSEQREIARVRVQEQLNAAGARVLETAAALAEQRKVLDERQQQLAALEGKARDLHIIIHQRDTSRAQAEEKLTAESARLREATAAMTERQQALEAERQRSSIFERLAKDLQDKLKIATEDLQKETTAAAELRQALESETKRAAAAEASVLSLKSAVELREQARAQAESKAAEEAGRATAAETSLAEHRERLGEERARSAAQTKEVADLRATCERIEALRLSVQNKLETVCAEAASRETRLIQEGDRLNQLATTTSRRLEELKVNCIQVDSERDRLRAELAGLTKRLSDSEVAAQGAAKQLKAEQQRTSELSSRLLDLQKIIEQRDQVVDELQRLLATEKQRAVALEGKVKDLHVIITQRDAARIRAEESLAAELARGQATAAETNTVVAALQSMIKDLQETVRQGDAARVQTEEHLAAELTRGRAAAAEANTAAAALQSTIKDLHVIIRQRDVARVQAEEKLASESAAAALRLATVQNEIEALRGALRHTQAVAADLDTKGRTLDGELAVARQESATLRSALAVAEAQKQALSAEFEATLTRRMQKWLQRVSSPKD